MWIARDNNNRLYLYRVKPKYDSEYTQSWHIGEPYSPTEAAALSFKIDSALFPELKCEDGPVEVELSIVKKNQETETMKSCSNCRAKNDYPKCFSGTEKYCEDWLPMYRKK